MRCRLAIAPVGWCRGAVIALLAFVVLKADTRGEPAASPQGGAEPRASAAAKPTEAERAADAQAIRDAGAEYLRALERGDAKALADLWTADGDIVDERGATMNGRETVAGVVPAAAGQPPRETTLRMKETSLRFLTADVAIEDGTVEVVPAAADDRPHASGGATTTGRFTATWVREDSTWRIAGLRESRIDPDAGRPRLADLDWMVGDWQVIDNTAASGVAGSREPQPTMEVSVRWNATRTFLLRDMKISKNGGAGAHITQRIGWDPLSRQIRSWMFAADGAHGEGTWTRDGDAWLARTTSVMPDGSQMSALNIYVYDGADRCTWRSFHTHVGGAQLPPVNMTMIRKPGSPSK